MAQPAHPQPQDDFPLLLLRTILTTTAATRMIKTALMMIVAIFSIIHVSIAISPFHSYSAWQPPKTGLPCIVSYLAVFSFMSVVSFVASL